MKQPRLHIVRYEDQNLRPGHCGVSIYEGDGALIVIVTELPDSQGTTMHGSLERIAKKIHAALLHGLDPTEVRWMEHYPARPANGVPSREEVYHLTSFLVVRQETTWQYEFKACVTMNVHQVRKFFESLGQRVPPFEPPIFPPLASMLGTEGVDKATGHSHGGLQPKRSGEAGSCIR